MRDPAGVSAPTASSPALAHAIAEKVDPRRAGLVVELGPGTGVVTKALLDRGIAAHRLLLVEQGQYFIRLLTNRFPAVTVIQGDAMCWQDYLPKDTPVAAVVSGLPLLNFSAEKRFQLLAGALNIMGPGARFIQLSYGWMPPISRVNGRRPEKTLVWRNLPPAHIWTYQNA